MQIYVSDLSELTTSTGHALAPEGKGGPLALGFARGGFSKQSINAPAGMVFEAEARVWGYRAGKVLPVKFGPVFFDAAGQVVRWWAEHELPVWPEGQVIRVRETVPPGAATARLGIHGPWRKDDATNLVYEFSGATMRRFKP